MTGTPAPLPWKIEEIAYGRVDPAAMADREELFYIVTMASFIETISDLTTRNLISYFADDPEVRNWLALEWEQEELLHGRALRDYVLAAWPDFDWYTAYAGFEKEYAAECTVDAFEPTRALELAARCVVETGTAVYYRAIQDLANEPVLHELAGRIRSDEVRHYKHFLRYFNRYSERENLGRWPVLRAVKRRLLEVRSDDAQIALWHAFAHRHAGEPRGGTRFQDTFDRVGTSVRRHLSTTMAVKMLLKPLKLPPWLAAALNAPLAKMTDRFVLR